jgi:uncharacterized membrane protein YcaP (DUF421 family)
MTLLQTLFGEGEHLNPVQMGLRALVTFFVALLLIRVAGMRTFGRRSAFDTIESNGQISAVKKKPVSPAQGA